MSLIVKLKSRVLETLLVVVCILITNKANAQVKVKVYDPTLDQYVLREFDSLGSQRETNAYESLTTIRSILPKGDTTKGLADIDRLQEKYPGCIVFGQTAILKGDIYWNRKDTTQAIKQYKTGIIYEDTFHRKKNIIVEFNSDKSRCFDLCVILSEYYFNKKEIDSSIYFLDLASNKFNKYEGCGNTYILYISLLSSYYAKNYLALHDTDKAKEILLFYLTEFDCYNPDSLSAQFRSLIKGEYTDKKIRREIRKGIRKIKYTDKEVKYCRLYSNTTNKIELSVFNVKIVKASLDDNQTLKKWRKYLWLHRGVKCLMNAT